MSSSVATINWLQLSPTTSLPMEQGQENALPSPLPSPAVAAAAPDVAPADELSLSSEPKFLSNTSSRSSSMSSITHPVISRHPPLGQRAHAISSIERREATIGRGIATAFGAHN